jgi:very-short-patch-repair endonuclease
VVLPAHSKGNLSKFSIAGPASNIAPLEANSSHSNPQIGHIRPNSHLICPMTELHNRPEFTHLRRELRHNMPPAERHLWPHLRQRRLENCKFRRQHGIDRYIVDFYASELKLAIEIDGPTHDRPEDKQHDAARQAYIESVGTVVLRFSNGQVYNDLEGVLGAIGQTIRRLRTKEYQRVEPHPSPLLGKERGYEGPPKPANSPKHDLPLLSKERAGER